MNLNIDIDNIVSISININTIHINVNFNVNMNIDNVHIHMNVDNIKISIKVNANISFGMITDVSIGSNTSTNMNMNMKLNLNIHTYISGRDITPAVVGVPHASSSGGAERRSLPQRQGQEAELNLPVNAAIACVICFEVQVVLATCFCSGALVRHEVRLRFETPVRIPCRMRGSASWCGLPMANGALLEVRPL